MADLDRIDAHTDRDRRFARGDIEAIQKSTAGIDEKKVDELLGVVGDFKADEDFIGPEAAQRFAKEKWGYQGTSYETIRAIVRAVNPQSEQTVYDLGSGQGRFVLYGALATSAKYIGIELLQERVDACNKSKARLGIENVEFRAGNIMIVIFLTVMFFIFLIHLHRLLHYESYLICGGSRKQRILQSCAPGTFSYCLHKNLGSTVLRQCIARSQYIYLSQEL